MPKILTDDQAQQVRDALHLAGVVLRNLDGGDHMGEHAEATRRVGRACLMLDGVPTDTGGRDGRTRDRTMLDDIFGSLDGEEWDSDTTAEIGQVFTDNGWTIHAPGHYEEEE